ncbi:MAG TPA: prepilin-type N-terminal cleavage/methylation domain-containing protein [Candidatus Paceibacterota bacterium]
MKKTFTRGFTLIELLVVIAIIAILASIILASLNQARVKSRDARRIADVKQLQNALELYNNDNGQYPTALAALAPKYIATIPTDPLATTTQYQYAGLQGSATSAATCSSYHLGATLEQQGNTALNGRFGGTVGGTYDTGVQDGAVCTNSGADFAGTGQVYDLRP